MRNKSKNMSSKKMDDLTPEHHQRIHTIIIGYTAFLFAFFLGLASFTEKTTNVSLVMGLILISLPALISLVLIDFIVRVKQSRRDSAMRGLAILIGFGPSIFALGLFVWPYAAWASIVFGISIPVWAFVITEVAGARPDSKI